MNGSSPLTPDEQADVEDNDPWTSFGPYSDVGIAAARALLEHASITFYIGPDGFPDVPPSPTPRHLWVHDDHVGRAQSILVPYIKAHSR